MVSDTLVSIYRTFLGTAATMVGAERMARLAARLQHVAGQAIHPIIKTRIDELTGELDMFREAIRTHVKSIQYGAEI